MPVTGQLSHAYHHVVIEWAVEDIFSYKANESRDSPCFFFHNYKWCLRIYPNFVASQKSVGWTGLYLVKGETSTPPIRASVTFGIKRRYGEVVNQRHVNLGDMFSDNLDYCGHPKFIERSELTRRRAELAPSNTLTLTCTLLAENGSVARYVQNTLSENLAHLFLSKRSSDTTLKVKNEGFAVHKCILEARSPVFAAMFEADMKEKQTGVVDIEDCDPEAFRCFLLYLYSGKFEINPDKVFELYKIADKYCVKDLKTACVLFIICHLKLETFFEDAIFANKFGEDKLQLKIQQFFNDNFGKILSTSDWVSFLKNNMTLANELLKNMASDKGL